MNPVQVIQPQISFFEDEDLVERHHVPERTALEEAFPAVRLSELAEAESWRKEIHRPATHTHKWWAQRLGTVFRGIIASAVTTSAEEAVSAFERRLRLHGLSVYDPFAGSGTTLVEAAKVGATVVGIDINPVATLRPAPGPSGMGCRSTQPCIQAGRGAVQGSDR